MSQPRYLYLMISRTDTNLGAFIRMFLAYPYNHCAMTLDPTLRNWVAFGRFRRNVPFYCGFITESVERYLAKKGDAQVRIFRVEISEDRYRVLSQLFSRAGKDDKLLLYNYFDAIATFFHQKIPVSNAYTCLGFARAVLNKDWANIRQLSQDMEPHLFYEGSLRALVADSGDRTDRYFTDLPFPQATSVTCRQLTDLAARFVMNSNRDWVAQKLRGSA